jgi:K(+)-stimulated pyrophosphate-energized sodium pump
MLPGILIGAVLPYVFSSMTMTAVGKAAFEIVMEVRRQFREIPGLMEGTGRPDYKTCVAISTQSALREMILPGAIAVIAPLLVGYILGAEALAGMLVGAIVSGFTLAVMMANAGGAWDNAKKWIETGEMGGKGSDAHKAAVVGDTVGDPFKDTSGPSLNILIKLMSIVALVFASTFGAGLF